MDARYLLLNRVSCGKLGEPAPTQEQLHFMYSAASRAADHAGLKPWRFLEVAGEGLTALGQLFAKAAGAANSQMTESDLERLSRKPLRAPMIIIAIARYTTHPKVPEWEQLVTAGCAAQNVINAAFAAGVGVYWRTGSMAENRQVAEGLGLAENEKIVGFIYAGTPTISLRETGPVDPSAFVSHWP